MNKTDSVGLNGTETKSTEKVAAETVVGKAYLLEPRNPEFSTVAVPFSFHREEALRLANRAGGVILDKGELVALKAFLNSHFPWVERLPGQSDN